MAKKPLNVEQGVQLDKQGSARTYNERDEGLLYNNQNLGIRVQTEGADRELLTDTQTQAVQNKSLDNTNSVVIKDTNLTIEDQSSPTKNIKFDVASVSTSQVFRFPDTTDEIVTKNFAQTISGKSIDADTNTISNLEVDNFKSGVVITSVSSVSTNNEIPTSQAVFGFVSSGVSTDLSNHLSDTTDAHDGSAISNIPSGNLAATDMQGAVNELQSDIDTRALDSGVVHNTGNENVAGIKTFTDITESTTKDNGAVVIEGGLGVEKNVNIGGDLVVTGGLQVNGTTTFVNTTNMEIKDANIVLNKGGNQAAADAADAGFTVEITDGVNAQFGYNSTKSSKFELGQVGSVSEVVTCTHSQVLSNKTIDGDDNTIQDVGISSLKTVLADASKFIARDGSGAVVSTNTVPSGTVVGTSDTQILTNKDIDGGTASNSKRITIPKDTVANLNSLTRKEATVVYATDTDKLYVDDGSTLNPVGSGGVGNPAVYSLLKSDEDTGTWSTGNNATFLGGGSIAGTFTKQNATSPLNGTYSYTLVQAAGSLNDYIASDVQAVPLRSRGVTNASDLVYTYDGSDNDIKWVVYDVTNATVVTPVTAYVKASSVGKTAQLVYDLPVTCTQVRFGAQVVVANSGKTLKFDDVQLSTWTPQAVNLVEQESAIYYGNAGGSNSSPNGIQFSTLRNSSLNKLGSWDGFVFTAKKKSIVNITANIRLNNSYTGFAYLYVNRAGVDTYVSLTPVGVIAVTSLGVSGSAELNPNDTLRIVLSSTNNLLNSTEHLISITASAISENVVQSWQDGTEWTSYTPTFSAGFGTVTNAAGKWKRSGSDLEVFVSCTTGNAVASLATVSLPSGLSIDSSKLTINNTTSNPGNLVGTYNSDNTNTGMIGTVVTAPATSTNLFYFGASDGSTSVSKIRPANANGIVGNSIVFTFYAKVPIAGWSSTPTLLALPTSKENRFDGEFNAAGAIQQPNNAVIGNAVVSDTSLYTIPLQAGVFTVAPNVVASLNFNQPTGSGSGIIGVVSVSTTQVVVRTGYVDSNGYTVRYALPFTINVSKKSPDYTAPGVFVGNVQPEWQYDLTVTGTNWTTYRAVGVVKKMASGQYRLEFNIVGAFTSGTRTSGAVSISGVTFKSASYDHGVTGMSSSAAAVYSCFASQNGSTITVYHASATTQTYSFMGVVELESKPTFAVNTP